MPATMRNRLCEQAAPEDRQAWFTWPAGAEKQGSPAGLPRGNYAQELVVQAGPKPDVPAVFRIPTRDHANHRGASAAVSRSEDGHRSLLHYRHRAGPAPPRQAVAAAPSDVSPDGRLALLHHAPPAARFDQESADPRAEAWCARRARSDRAAAE